MPIIDKFKDMRTVVMGKVESGTVREGDSLLVMPNKAIFTAGYKAILHIHSVVEECEIIELLHQIDPKTRKPMKKKVLFVKNGANVVCRIQFSSMICLEKFSDFPQLGRFTLRSEGKTVAVEKITALDMFLKQLVLLNVGFTSLPMLDVPLKGIVEFEVTQESGGNGKRGRGKKRDPIALTESRLDDVALPTSKRQRLGHL
ncbi:hypothetical protein PIB30_079958 [Stylosanthes scabra]|uniref:GTP-eEF1A C-terminal domain-containing protein n=1 Tax=Stylosanthes scabra TaxID=79078 RepID=A0ABU6XS93_9FABA|nr:hypothetical protein [Stylosanthes scabra]